jgi:hypothetical protein
MKETQTKTYNMIMKEKGKKNIGKGCTGMDFFYLTCKSDRMIGPSPSFLHRSFHKKSIGLRSEL